ncbi:lipopolysaccharide heptosyltransferase II [Rhizobacter sp. Root404]|uniref:lipopolysaccharide heptosyltransferase II n=1 Tax=Rhizobacter sp. Root404 TaxID=1736528 RepID=UPI0006FA7B2E|nr:lipopolysaccharide heptosyltransferase II [Rhizobacter sp. Root404]KQW34278.1 lipopolysaccharide heptosyltransferase [Rhizobacter sp. Root404]
MSRSLIIAPQWIGDAVMTEPLLASLAARGEQLTVAALPWVAPVYRAMPQVTEVIDLPFAHGRLDWAGRRRVAAALRGRFDTAYVLPNSLKSALLPWLAGIPRRVGYHGEGRYLLLNRRLPNPAGRPPMVAFYSALAGEPPVAGERPTLRFDAATLTRATAAAGVAPGAYWAFAPGAEYGPAKCWPPEHYAELARVLHARDGQPVLLLGSGKEAALCAQIEAAADGACRVLAGQTSLIDAMALIAAARGVVSNDSGLMHVAAAFGVPQAAVFGSTSPEHTPPLNPRARVLWLKEELQLDCAPCFDRVCRFGHTRCLTGVSAGRVEQALDDALGGPQSVSLPT